MENKTYQFKKLTKEVLESLEPKGRYTILFCNGDVKQMVLELNTDGSGVFLDGFARFPISRYEDISVLLPLSKVGEVTQEQVEIESRKRYRQLGDNSKEFGFNECGRWILSLLQPQPVNSEGKDCSFCGQAETDACKNGFHAVSSEGKVDEKFSETIIVRVDPETKQAIQKLADEMELSLSQYMRLLIQQKIDSVSSEGKKEEEVEPVIQTPDFDVLNAAHNIGYKHGKKIKYGEIYNTSGDVAFGYYKGFIDGRNEILKLREQVEAKEPTDDIIKRMANVFAEKEHPEDTNRQYDYRCAIYDFFTTNKFLFRSSEVKEQQPDKVFLVRSTDGTNLYGAFLGKKNADKLSMNYRQTYVHEIKLSAPSK